jgi:hypothetical protein
MPGRTHSSRQFHNHEPIKSSLPYHIITSEAQVLKLPSFAHETKNDEQLYLGTERLPLTCSSM